MNREGGGVCLGGRGAGPTPWCQQEHPKHHPTRGAPSFTKQELTQTGNRKQEHAKVSKTHHHEEDGKQINQQKIQKIKCFYV
jgi:hypothetical protein